MKRVVIFGSTGSIGLNTIEVLKYLKNYKIVGLATYSNYKKLIHQVLEMKPEYAVLVDRKYCSELRKALRGKKVLCGEDGLLEMIEKVHADTLVAAFSSAIGIYAILSAIKKGLRICLATKEILVSFGEIVMKEVKNNCAQLIPIDSEHSAIFQCLEGRNPAEVDKIILTASGGPFLKRSIKNVCKSDVLKHPVWKMGKKITVDSATMMNKALEIIEAHYLFGIPPDKIKVVIHPEAICHSIVQFIDGSLIGQFSLPDMKLPIQYALTAPERKPSLVKSLELDKIRQLNFFTPDYEKFPGLLFAYDALRIGKSMPAVLNGANEEAVKAFLADKLKFHEIPVVIKKAMSVHKPISGGIEEYMEAEMWAKKFVNSVIARKEKKCY
ncbi:MAG: 1-deoxy-D-xylulose-5-phosphate reductoisomerase [candidate division WOR-3 bacterium]|nr:1-deoxy-D-xylulose-5-phosphate reductoisomerase [candidate division WOR-3 bacterium]